MRGTREAKRKRQYRARAKRREREITARYRAWVVKTTPRVGPQDRYGFSLLASVGMKVMSWKMARALAKETFEWDWFTDAPSGAAIGVTLDNPNGIVPVIPGSAEGHPTP